MFVARIVLAVCIAALIAAPVTDAQGPKRTPVIGYLGNQSAASAATARLADGFREGLAAGGWVDGQTVRVERRWAEGRPERYPELAAELVRLNVDVLVTPSSQATKAAKEATSTIPIVFIAVGDPVGAGFVSSLGRPGGNVTGITNQLGDLDEKWIQLAREVAPRLKHYAIMWNPADASSTVAFNRVQSAFPIPGVKTTSVPVRRAEDFDVADEIIAREHPEFLHVHPTALVFVNRKRLGELTARHRLPSISGARALVDDGTVMMSYGPDFADLFRRGGALVDKVLKGARPAELPVEQPTKFELAINVKAARALGVPIPRALLLRATQVIE